MLSSIRLLLSILVLTSAMGASAAEMCARVFTDGPGRIQVARATGQGSKELADFKASKQSLKALLQQVPAERRQQIEHLLSAVEFFDYTHTAGKILSNYLDGRREVLDFTTLYDRTEAKGAPFRGFLNARQFLMENRPPVTAELLLEIHKRIMAEGVEGLRPDQLGAWKNQRIIGNSVADFRMTVAETKIIESNPYLTFQEFSQETVPVQSVWTSIKIWGRSNKDHSGLKLEAPTLVNGQIQYPSVTTPKQAAIDIIKDSHPQVWAEVMEARKTMRATPELEAKLTKAFVEERFARFNRDREALGQVELGRNEKEYIDLVADLQRDLVAIHPMANGNGRTTRLFMNYLLTSEGLPPVRLVDPFLDIQVAPEKWREAVRLGVLNEARLVADIKYRVENGLTVEYSPEFLYPGLPEKVSIAQKKQGGNKAVEDFKQIQVEPEQFSAFMKTMVAEFPELKAELQNDRLRTMSRLAELFSDYFSSKTVNYIHQKDGAKDVRLRLVESDFFDLFGVQRAGRKDLWDNKIDRWYDREQLVWRGLADRNRERSDEELLEFFKAPSTHLASNQVLRSLNSGKKLIDIMKDDFLTYNKEMINGKLVEMADDHHKEGPRYGTSYGFSTSKREVVGKAFAMGAMVIAEYGKHHDPALQAQLKSRINIAAYKAEKDVDLGRLKAFDQDFSYIYGRQAEVMGVGGTDADAVMVVQRIGADGEVMHSFVRDSNNPSQVLMIAGRYVPGEGAIPADKVLKRFDIVRGGAVELKTADAQQAPQAQPAAPAPRQDAKTPQQQAPPDLVIPQEQKPNFWNGLKKLFGR